MTFTRLLIDPPARGSWNMAVDEVLLDSAARDGTTSLRFYCWSEPTLSLGYFQKYSERFQHHASRRCPVVRRASGGGAILHDKELTYSFATPVERQSKTKAEDYYQLFHETLVKCLADKEVAAALFDNVAEATIRDQPFLCFQRRTTGDVVLRGKKIAGSAQRRTGKAVLQHGSVLLSASSAAPQLPGIDCLEEATFDVLELAEDWAARLAQSRSSEYRSSSLSNLESQRAIEFETRRFRDWRWTHRR